ncbi:MAG TPA: DUF4388 domain-containing protein [Caldisericia bacterium]|nr:DUF4388 domain-containing protein [Caldisericales bacterium]HOR47261.1 DUF4388 domain-containing protein [Caldisericia bacterium]HOU08139.1 DUF4388 domain-containing protein [Caldisericia bacterium]HPL90007.1 DUF4388 domain-containing protein [Caldisericia bacterium]HQG59479.1 DUF4388 domain-containing protein [Caldisericia bacterium]
MIFTGYLDDFDLIDFIRFITTMKKSGVLVITGKKSAKIVLSFGKITGVVVPFEVRNHYKSYIADLKDGYFSLEESHSLNEDEVVVVSQDVSEFLLELTRFRREPSDPKLYEPNMLFELKPISDIGRLTFNVEEWRIIAALSESRTLKELSERLEIGIARLQWMIYSLEQSGLIKRKRPQAQRERMTQNAITEALKRFIGILKGS